MVKKTVAVTGPHGFIGSHLVTFLEEKGYDVIRLVRRHGVNDTVYWDPKKDTIEEDKIKHIDALVHLAGEPITGRWTKSKKHRIWESRDEGTQFLSNVLAGFKKKPVFISASAIGFYGDRANHILDENSEKGEGFLSDVCATWEDATTPAKEGGVRVVNMRLGVVLEKNGGALNKMMRPFKLGLGGIMGSGDNYFSWVSMRDVCRAIEFCIRTKSMHGPVNVTSPNPVTSEEFSKTLGSVLKRPVFLRIPSFCVRLLFGQMGKETMLASQRVLPKKLKSHKFTFEDDILSNALESILSQ